MSLPSTGELSFAAIRTELGLSGAIDLNNSSVRGLAGKASGAISFSDLMGKSNAVTVTKSYGVANVSTDHSKNCDVSELAAKVAAGLFNITVVSYTQSNKVNSYTFSCETLSSYTDNSSSSIYTYAKTIITAYNASTGAVLAQKSVALINTTLTGYTTLTLTGSPGVPVRFEVVLVRPASKSGPSSTFCFAGPHYMKSATIIENHNQY